jgi:propionyl-CoA carboxylase alpha chain
MGIKTVAVYSDADRDALHVEMADEAVHIGPPPRPVLSRHRQDHRGLPQTGAEAVHPGYGFLSENARPSPRRWRRPASSSSARTPRDRGDGRQDHLEEAAAKAGVSTVPGYMGLIADADEAVKIADEIGYPVMIKASAGGGGKGMRIAWNDEEAPKASASSKNEAKSSVRRRPHLHREVRRPAAPHRDPGAGRQARQRRLSRRARMLDPAPQPEGHRGGAVAACSTRRPARRWASRPSRWPRPSATTSAGTVEFVVDRTANFYFLEMNTRLQVEHPVTELITGVDLVEQMIRVAAGEKLPFKQKDVKLNGWAVESRLYAEDPYRNFLPSIGRLTRYRPPAEARRRRRHGAQRHRRLRGRRDLDVLRPDDRQAKKGDSLAVDQPIVRFA